MLRRAAWPLLLALALLARAAVPAPGTETPIATGPGNQSEPAIGYPYVAYADFASGTPHVRYWDGSSGGSLHAVPAGGGAQQAPAIAAGVIAYADADLNGGNIRLYSILTGATSPAAAFQALQSNPCVSDRLVAWEDARQGSTVIWVRDLLLGGDRAVSGPGQQLLPRCSGPQVVYVDRAAGDAVKVWSADAQSTATVFAGPASSADVDQGNVAVARRTADGGEIEVYSAAGSRLASLLLTGLQVNPHISGDFVAFEDHGTGASRVVLWNWKTGGLQAPPPGDSFQKLNDLEWPRVVYADDRSGDFDVFMYEIAPTPPPDGGADGGADGGVDGGVDGGGDGGADGGVDGGVDGGPDGGADGGPDGGADGGVDGGTDGGADGGGPVRCEDPNATVLAELELVRGKRAPEAANVHFEVPREMPVLVCMDAEHVSSAWVFLDDEAVATPNDFNPHVTHLEGRSEVGAGRNRLGAILAGKPGARLGVRVLADPGGNGDDARDGSRRDCHHHAGDGDRDCDRDDDRECEHDRDPNRDCDGGDRERRDGGVAHLERGLQAAWPADGAPGQGCGTGGLGLLAAAPLLLLLRRRR